MKLTLAIATALSGLLYLIVKAFVPDFPIEADQFLRLVILLLGALGVVVTEAKLRAWFVRNGYTGFK